MKRLGLRNARKEARRSKPAPRARAKSVKRAMAQAEAVEQNKAISEILQVISSSPADLQPVFDTILSHALRLAEGDRAALWQYDGEMLRFAAHKHASPEGVAYVKERPLPLGDYNPTPQAGMERRTVHVLDVFAERRYRPIIPAGHAPSSRPTPTVLAVPLVRGDELFGVMSIWRHEKRLFSDRQIAMVEAFAAQAALAIHNVRLLNETREALEQQTATSEVLGVISRSPTDLRPVFEAILKSATELCEAHLGLLDLYDGEKLRTVAQRGGNADVAKWAFERGAFTPDSHFIQRVIAEKRPSQIADLRQDSGYRERRPNATKFVELGGARTFLAVPLLKDDKIVGNIAIYRPEVRPFTDKQIALVSTFANQAVIAIENVRLFNQLKSSNSTLREALDQQTATAEILKVISSSPTDVQPVFDTIVRNSVRLCDGAWGALFTFDNGMIDLGAQMMPDPKVALMFRTSFPQPIDDRMPSAVAILERRVVNVPDIQATDYAQEVKDRARAVGYRSVLTVPMMRGDIPIGSIAVTRREAGAFSEPYVSLLQTFADQAVIAIENVRLFNETKEALEQQTAISDVLRVISNSPTDVQPVLEAVAARAAKICNATDARIFLVEGEHYRHAAGFGDVGVMHEVIPLNRDTPSGRAIVDRAPQHIHDIAARSDFALGREIAGRVGWRTILSIPLLREDRALGTIVLRRKEVRPFSDKQVALLKTFADQAAIAIENARLFKELQSTNATLREALEQQTATGEILKVIASATTEVQPVFDTIVRNAARLGNAAVGFLISYDGATMQLAAQYNVDPEEEAIYRPAFPRPAARDTMTGRAILDRTVINLADIQSSDFGEGTKGRARRAGYRSALVVPMLRGGVPIGSLNIQRREAGAFPDSYVALLKTFADQAVIAIENVRLFNETKEALEQQTAISEVLRVISGSPVDVQPVLDAVAVRAARICDASDARIFLVDGGALRQTAGFGDVPTTIKRGDTLPLTRDSVVGRAIIDRAPLHIEDFKTLPAEEFPVSQKIQAGSGWRTNLSVPLLREDRALGAIVLRRMQVRPFTDKQIELVKTFADQAAIAIENVRLFNETKEALERQRATSEVLGVISSSPTDVAPVYRAILDNVTRLCEAKLAALFLYDGEFLTTAAHCNATPDFASYLDGLRIAPSRETPSRRAALERRVVHVEDALSDASFSLTARHLGERFRTVLSVPLLREGELAGVITIWRREPRLFSDQQVALVKTFADQAVIAIENARLFKELQERTEALTKSVDQLTALGEVGQAISSTLDLETVLKTIVSRAVQLTGLDGGSIYEYDEPTEEFRLQAAENMDPELVEAVRRTPVRKGDGAIGRSAVSLEPVQVPDIFHESYQSARKELLVRAGYRAILAVPLLREDHMLGAILVNRSTPGPFAPEVVDLLKTFATQSAMAIQNARLFREIAEKGRQLEVASHHKSQFLASMSHELRTPLNALLGFNEMILGDVYGEVPGDMKPPLAQMQASGKHLLRLINNVLDLAKIEAGRMELALSDYSVHDTVESVRSALRPLAADKGIELLAEVPADIPLAYGDPGRITQCLMNLAGNSLKFTKAGKVEISVVLNDGRLRYSVADTGIGIPADKIDSLFTEFKQTDATIASEYGGTGLGLSITKKFIEMHGGRIWVESEPGHGSTFSFEIPLRAQEARAA